jgi:hypothetical protein
MHTHATRFLAIIQAAQRHPPTRRPTQQQTPPQRKPARRRRRQREESHRRDGATIIASLRRRRNSGREERGRCRCGPSRGRAQEAGGREQELCVAKKHSRCGLSYSLRLRDAARNCCCCCCWMVRSSSKAPTHQCMPLTVNLQKTCKKNRAPGIHKSEARGRGHQCVHTPCRTVCPRRSSTSAPASSPAQSSPF